MGGGGVVRRAEVCVFVSAGEAEEKSAAKAHINHSINMDLGTPASAQKRV